MPSLEQLVTNLQNYKYYSGYGNFTTGPGNTTPKYGDIPDDGVLPFGASATIKASVDEVANMSKFLYGTSQGRIFVLKQTGLQLTNPETLKTNHKKNNILSAIDNIMGGPTRIYNLGVNTLAQVAVEGFGKHFVSHGLLPVLSSLDNETYSYEKAVQSYIDVDAGTDDTALVKLMYKLSDPVNDIITDYQGGPKSMLGIGRTTIRRKYYSMVYGNQGGKLVVGSKDRNVNTISEMSYKNILALDNSQAGKDLYYDRIKMIRNPDNYGYQIDQAKSSALSSNISWNIENSGVSSDQIYSSTDSLAPTSSFDFSKEDYRKFNYLDPLSGYNGPYSEYSVGNMEKRIGLSRSRRVNDLEQQFVTGSKYGRFYKDADDPYNSYADKVNMISLIYGPAIEGNDFTDLNRKRVKGYGGQNQDTISNDAFSTNDLVKFRIASYDNDNPNNKVYMVFRAFINNINDKTRVQ